MSRTELMREADELLAKIAETKTALESVFSEHDRIVQAAKETYAAKAEPLKGRLNALEGQLKKLGKAHRDELFASGDRLVLEHGDLVLQVGEHVVRAKAVTVELLEAQGWPEGVKVIKAVDWDVVGQWPEERLAALGTRRQSRVAVTYELPEG